MAPLMDGTETQEPAGLRRVFEKFSIDRPGKIVLVEHHLSTKTSIRCLIRTISLQGAELEVTPHIPVPSHFFLAIRSFSFFSQLKNRKYDRPDTYTLRPV